MFADTLTVTINGAAKVLARVNQDGFSSEYRLREATGNFTLRIRNSTYSDKSRGGIKVDRHNVELTEIVYAVAPSTTDIKRKAFGTFEHDVNDSIVGPVKLSLGLFSTVLTEVNMTKLTNFES